MTKTKKWASAVLIDVVMFGLLYGWLVIGLEGAGNVFKVVFWVIVPLAIMGSLSQSAWKEMRERPRGYTTYHIATDIVTIVVLAWAGHVWMAAIRLVSLIVIEVGYANEMKRRAAA